MAISAIKATHTAHFPITKQPASPKINEKKIHEELEKRGISEDKIKKTVDFIKKIVSNSIEVPYNNEGMAYLRKNKTLPLTLQVHKNGDVYIHFKSNAALQKDVIGYACQKVVYRAINQAGEVVAASVMKSRYPSRNKRAFENEKAAMIAFKGCKYVLQGFHASTYLKKNSTEEKYGIIAEYCHGRADKTFLESLPPKERWTFFLNILEGAHDIHKRGYVHFDFKSDNILYKKIGDRYEPRIIDFGIMHLLYEQLPYRTLGFYLPPEDKIQANYPLVVTERVDVWALGRYAADVLLDANAAMWIEEDDNGTERGVLHADWENAPEESREFVPIIQSMLDCNPQTRITMNAAIRQIKEKIALM